MSDKFTIQQVRNYVEGWLTTSSDTSNLSINEIKALLSIALICLDDHNDGIASYVERFPESNNKE
jgi:hypothetical protein